MARADKEKPLALNDRFVIPADLNRERFALIEKKYKGPLSADENRRLMGLQILANAYRAANSAEATQPNLDNNEQSKDKA